MEDNVTNSCRILIQILRSDQVNDLSLQTPTLVVFGVAYTVIFIAGVIGNAGIVFGVCRSKSLRNLHSVLVASLASSDALTCFFCLPVTAYSLIYKEWIFGAWLCKLITFLQATSVLVSAFSLVGISVHRYFMVVRLNKDAPLKMVQVCIFLAGTWISAGLIALPLALKLEQVNGSYFSQNEPFCNDFCVENWEYESLRLLYGAALLGFQYIFPLTIIAYCCCSVLRKLHKQEHFRSATATLATRLANSRRQANERRSRSLNRNIALVVIIFGVSWLPQILLNILRDSKSLPRSLASQEYLVSLVAHCIAMSSTVWNPILYAGTNTQFKGALMFWADQQLHGGSVLLQLIPFQFRSDTTTLASTV